MAGVEPIGLLACTDHRQWRHDQLRPIYTLAPRALSTTQLPLLLALSQQQQQQRTVNTDDSGSQAAVAAWQRGSAGMANTATLHMTHSSYWLAKMATKKNSITSDYSSIKDDLDSWPPSRKQSTVTEPGSELDSSSILTDESPVEEFSQDEEWPRTIGHERIRPKRVKICEGGYKSNEDYTYVRGRGRGKYVCEECGIRCKKPSMLKKHIRTHTDLRPYFCAHCEFAFKTKGNLTKHMKSKAHHKKCVEMGIVPVPTQIDDSHVDHEQLAKQVFIYIWV
ncbi:hypothetical protein BIW11_03661 [Tropilaelaps mercedesae]|uniref:C2H2-type domain-containing protein n=1 Tax=Tropilaelaps mercedesae TaxID=418985 RepID=A0A1V9XHP9_9ACAR|nr:hypothetical protein BIW11_03661 [Tropilaelaps mercedesae]